MYAGNGAGEPCDGCAETIERTQLEWEAVGSITCTLGVRACGMLSGNAVLVYIADGPAKKAVHEQHE
jgi:hypothetical protein